MSDTPRKPVRFVIPNSQPKAVEVVRVNSKPELHTLLDDCLSIFQTEILKMKQDVNKGNSLNPAQANVLQGYVKTLVQAAKEIRERDENETRDLEKLNDTELLERMEAEAATIRERILKGTK